MSTKKEINAKIDGLIALEKKQLENWMLFVEHSRRNIQLLKETKQGRHELKGVVDALIKYHEATRAALKGAGK